MNDNYINIIYSDIEEFNREFELNIKSKIPDFVNVLDYILSFKGKQIRPILGILFSKLLGNYNEKQRLFLQSIELVHNATLFHDDVIDEADERHKILSLHKKFSNKISILTGDYFLSSAIKNIYSIKNNNINELFSNYMKDICEGELEQNYSLNKLISINEYMEKTKKKTALLFELTTLGVTYLSDNISDANIVNAKNFGLNFGIAFQIKDDLNNFLNYQDKPVLNDLKSGVITLPVIFLSKEHPEIKDMLSNEQYDNIIDLLYKSDALNKTKLFINDYINKASVCLDSLNNNIYNQSLKELLLKLNA